MSAGLNPDQLRAVTHGAGPLLIVAGPGSGKTRVIIERVYLDCLANGERSTMDAIAIELLYEDRLTTRGLFPIQQVKKVQEDLPLLERR